MYIFGGCDETNKIYGDFFEYSFSKYKTLGFYWEYNDRFLLPSLNMNYYFHVFSSFEMEQDRNRKIAAFLVNYPQNNVRKESFSTSIS